jgi:hypothetical protein
MQMVRRVGPTKEIGMSMRQVVQSATAAAAVATLLHSAAMAQPAAAAQADPTGRPTAIATPEDLRATYLECDRLAMTTLLGAGTAATCSLVYEELKRRVFGGDFHRLWAWSRQQTMISAASGEAR